MLVLSRKSHEQIALTIPPSDVERTVIIAVGRIADAYVRLGIEAPRDVVIMRGELTQKNQPQD